MSSPRTERLVQLVRELLSLASETSWLEFKENNDDPDMIGEYISALSNSAVLDNRQNAYMVWGVRDSDHEIVGTTFKPRSKKIGSEDLLNWLVRGLKHRFTLSFMSLKLTGRVSLLLRSTPLYTSR